MRHAFSVYGPVLKAIPMASSRYRAPDQDDNEPASPANLPADDAAVSRLAGPADLDDFDDDFDDDFEAEVAGEYEMEDDEFARQLVEMVDFDIEGLTDNEEDGPDSPPPNAESR
jgi:hypothetical protein